MKKQQPKSKRKPAAVKPVVLPTIEHKPELDDGEADQFGLTLRQRAFVEALAGPAAGNATKAAELAGYRSDNRNALKVTACRLLTYANVQEALSLAIARKRMTPEWAQERLAELASTSMRNFMKVDENGEMIVDWDKANAAGALGQIGQVTEKVLKTIGDTVVMERKFKLFDPSKALELLLKLQGKLIQRKEITGRDGGAIKTETKHKIDYEQFAALYLRRSGSPAGSTDRVSDLSANDN